jgi:hypothetical protein
VDEPAKSPQPDQEQVTRALTACVDFVYGIRGCAASAHLLYQTGQDPRSDLITIVNLSNNLINIMSSLRSGEKVLPAQQPPDETPPADPLQIN